MLSLARLDTLKPDIWNRRHPPFFEGMSHAFEGMSRAVLRTLPAGSSSRNPLHRPIFKEQLLGMDSETTVTRPTGTF
jgi:hypothetical protein